MTFGLKETFRKIINNLRVLVFPTKHDKEVRRWWSDGGDEAFRYDYELNENSLVMDLGGYKGQWASDIYSRFCCHVLVFEPVRMFAEKIEERFRNNPKIRVFALALGQNRRKETIGLGADGSSIFRKSKIKETMQVEDVVFFFNKHNIQDIDLMKINVEGGEYELLERLISSGTIKIINNIQIQFHDVDSDSETRMESICKELEKTHRLTYRYKFVWENWVRR